PLHLPGQERGPTERDEALSRAAKTEVTEVLLVEDSPGDTRLTLEAIRDCDMPLNLNVVRDGFEAMAFLHREGRYGAVERPALILLDLNLPGKRGREVLSEIQGDPELRRIPVGVLTTSQSEDDIGLAYGLHATRSTRKPAATNQLSGTRNAIDDFRLTQT